MFGYNKRLDSLLEEIQSQRYLLNLRWDLYVKENEAKQLLQKENGDLNESLKEMHLWYQREEEKNKLLLQENEDLMKKINNVEFDKQLLEEEIVELKEAKDKTKQEWFNNIIKHQEEIAKLQKDKEYSKEEILLVKELLEGLNVNSNEMIKRLYTKVGKIAKSIVDGDNRIKKN